METANPTDTPHANARANAAAVPAPTPAPAPAPVHFADADGLFKTVCRGFMNRKCTKKECKFVHDKQLCGYFWKTGNCKFGEGCRKNHFVTVAEPTDKTDNEAEDSAADEDGKKKAKAKREPRKKEPKADGEDKKKDGKPDSDNKGKKKDAKAQPAEKKGKKDAKPSGSQLKLRTAKKNTECFEPMNRPVDLRVDVRSGHQQGHILDVADVARRAARANIFNDFKKGELYTRLMHEIDNCGVLRSASSRCCTATTRSTARTSSQTTRHAGRPTARRSSWSSTA
ncbi:hypothetical protein PINS_up024193 [Pythium insidiosum]|nr:hypothetical protein PINS_up024193 [Pythium insidiosum]